VQLQAATQRSAQLEADLKADRLKLAAACSDAATAATAAAETTASLQQQLNESESALAVARVDAAAVAENAALSQQLSAAQAALSASRIEVGTLRAAAQKQAMTDAAAKRELEALMERSRRSYSSKLSALQAEVERTAGYDAAVATAASAAAAEQAAQEQLKELRFELAGAAARLREVERVAGALYTTALKSLDCSVHITQCVSFSDYSSSSKPHSSCGVTS
jgi:chromosome segregation ATPase